MTTYGPRLHGIRNREKLDEIVRSSLTGAALWDEVKDKLKSPGTGLSGGQQQRLCIARASPTEPAVLLMDEPTSALDPLATRIEELVRELKKNYTVVIVTHNMRCPHFQEQDGVFLLGDLVEYDSTPKMFVARGQADGRLYHRKVRLGAEGRTSTDEINLRKQLEENQGELG